MSATAVLSIGTELTRGELVDSNAAWISEQLTLVGCEVLERATVPDDVTAIADALRRLAHGRAVLICTGGLGPTTDDLTAEAAARALGVGLVRDEASVEAIKRRFAAFGRTMSPSNVKQAELPEGATALENPVGTAPGIALTLDGCQCFFLPGVPHEMKRLFSDHVEPSLGRVVERRSHQIRLRTFGLPESVLGERLAAIEPSHPGVTVGYRASFPEVEVKLLARGGSEAEAEELAARAARDVRERLGKVAFGEGDETFGSYVGRVLRDRGLRLAIAESCTGGIIGAMLTDVPGSSNFLLLDAVTYSNASKSEVLGVGEELLRAHGAVSAESAAAMAEGARRVVDADLAVSVTGIAGPGGGTEDKPVGTVWIALARRGHEPSAALHRLAGERRRIRTLAAYLALDTVVRAAKELG
jgi:nicotinamide-nucleotide amidase